MKSFLYVDEYKLRSISSQLFHGFTDYILKSDEVTTEQEVSGDSAIGKGKAIADILKEHSSLKEKRYLLDYGYQLLEEELYSQKAVLDVNESNLQSKINDIGDFSFINIESRMIFNDTKLMSSLLGNFNDIGGALGYVQLQNEFNQIKELEKEVSKTKDRNIKAKQKRLLSKNSRKELLKEIGLNLDDEYLKALKDIVDFGYMGQLEIQMPIIGENDFSLFSAILDREYLREDEKTIIQKYSRETEKCFNLFGVVSQSGKIKSDQLSENFKTRIEDHLAITGDEMGMKQALINITAAMSNIEQTFTGKLDYEFVIDPIAIYRKLN